MVREASRRGKKYEAKVDAEVLSRQTTALKPLMVKGQAEYFPAITSLEEKVKKLVEAEGVTTLEVRDYLNFGREIYELSRKFSQTTLQAEAQLRVNKWVSRGLDGSLLVQIAQLEGVTPSAPPTPPTVLNLDDLEDVEITTPADKEVLTYESTSSLWKNKPITFASRFGVGIDPLTYSRLTLGELASGDIYPVNLEYNMIWASWNSAKLQAHASYLRALLMGGVLDVNGVPMDYFYGLFFAPTFTNKSVTPATIIGIEGVRSSLGTTTPTSSLEIQSRTCFRAVALAPQTGVTIGTQRGILVGALAGNPTVANVGIDVMNISAGATRILLRLLGLSGANLQVDAGDPESLGSDVEAQTNLLLSFNENGVVTVRRVQWKKQSELLSDDNVMVAV